MKLALILAACTTLIAAAAMEPTTFSVTEDISLPQDIFSITSNSDEAALQAPCGGLSPAQCSVLIVAAKWTGNRGRHPVI
ncbi:hypothetical protein BDV29DRAFT_157694 [Aspergillus leporis]|uniref:Uncharacterized protein n=1 Tax=Aspergillus leporis TaxID=41062 RepID=A0A5N5X1U5_9EURO|nr:hypothetical protein BDV29DRAFT_157694 [Aspergillus leporis]